MRANVSSASFKMASGSCMCGRVRFGKKARPQGLPACTSRSGAEARLRLLHELRERGLVEDRDVGQHLAVHRDRRLLQPVHEPAVGDPVLAGGGIDARDPQRAEFALAVTAVAVGVLARAHDRLVGDAEYVLAAAAVALGAAQDLLVGGARYDAAFYAWHGLFLGCSTGSGEHEGSIPSFIPLLIGKHRAHGRLVRRSYGRAAAQVSLALGVLLGEDVAQVRLVALDPAAGALLEALRRGAPRFQLGHDNSLFSL